MLPIFVPYEKYGEGFGMPKRLTAPSLNFVCDVNVVSDLGNAFHRRVVAGMNDRWKLVVLLEGSVSAVEFLSVLWVLAMRV